MKKRSYIPKPDYDARWKVIIEKLHPYFMDYFLPSLFKKIDFSKGVKILDKEVQKLFADWTKKGWRAGDKLLEYHLKKTGERQLVLVHVEVEYSGKAIFKELMFVRIRRLMDKYPNVNITAIVIYCGDNIPRNHDVYIYEYEGLEITCKFNAYVVKHQKVKELLALDNPFALVILACLYNLKSKNDMEMRLRFKLKLARLCFERDWKKKAIVDLLIFVSYTIALPIKKEDIYREEIIENLNIKDMALIHEPHHRSTMQVIEAAIFGETMEERDERRDKERDERILKKHILTLHESGLSNEAIAKGLKVESSFVLSVIDDNKKSSSKSKI